MVPVVLEGPRGLFESSFSFWACEGFERSDDDDCSVGYWVDSQHDFAELERGGFVHLQVADVMSDHGGGYAVAALLKTRRMMNNFMHP